MCLDQTAQSWGDREERGRKRDPGLWEFKGWLRFLKLCNEDPRYLLLALKRLYLSSICELKHVELSFYRTQKSPFSVMLWIDWLYADTFSPVCNHSKTGGTKAFLFSSISPSCDADYKSSLPWKLALHSSHQFLRMFILKGRCAQPAQKCAFTDLVPGPPTLPCDLIFDLWL